MTELQMRAVVAGIFFGLWPLFINRGGLGPGVTTTVMEGIVFLVVLPFGLWAFSTASVAGANWLMIVFGAVAGAIGVLVFNSGLALSSKETVNTFFVLTTMIQISIPAINQIIVLGAVTRHQLIGFSLAVGAAYFLNK